MKRKNWKVFVELTKEETQMLRDAVLKKRNELARKNGPTEDLDAILLKLGFEQK